MTDESYGSTTLRALTELKVELHDDRYEVEPIVQGGEFLYDPQIFWDWSADGATSAWGAPAGSVLISEIGGQPGGGTDWRMGHGGLYRLHADNTWETLVSPGVGRQCGVFRPMIAPDGWGDFGGHILFGSQVVPHRRGAVFDHMIYRLGPGDDKPEAFCIPPRSGSIDGGISGALVPGVFGRPGTPEEGLFLFYSMHNLTVYAARPDGSVEPYILMDGEERRPGPLMPYRMFYGDEQLVGEKDALFISGLWDTHFGAGGHAFVPGHYRVVGRNIDPTDVIELKGGPGHRAPPGFGPFAGNSFRPENNGFISSVRWSEGDAREALPYITQIMRRDADGNEHVFASNVQAGQNLIGFAGDRMIVTNMGHSYSSGNFKDPDGVVFAIRYKG